MPSLSVQGNWYPANQTQLNRWLNRLSAETREPTAPAKVAVFDFDNTCIHHDVGQAVFRSQLFALHFRLTPDELASLLQPHDAQPEGKSFNQVRQQLIDSYQQLWPFIQAQQVEVAKVLPAYEIFCTLLLWYYQKGRQEIGTEYALALLPKLHAHYTIGELEAFSRTALAKVAAESIGVQRLGVVFDGPLGEIQVQYETGLQPYQEMLNLMGMLQAQGVTCYVISASTQWVVRTAITHFSYPVNPACVFGVQVALTDEHCLTTEELVGYPVTYRRGKCEVIRRQVKGAIQMIAGDADTDYEMLNLPDIPIRLIINQNKGGLISTLYDDPRFLLQGLDKAAGKFHMAKETLEIGLP